MHNLELLCMAVEISLGTYLAINNHIPFLWAVCAIFGFGCFRHALFGVVEKAIKHAS